MTEDEFWRLVEAAGAGRDRRDGGEAIAGALAELLAAQEIEEILDYQEHFDRVHDALYQWKYWAAAYIIGGGCSDDSFIDFRAGVISLGRSWYERFLADPDSLADHEEVREQAALGNDEALFAEDVNYAATAACGLVAVSDREFMSQLAERQKLRPAPEEPDMGEEFDFDDNAEMSSRLPRLSALYGW